MDNFTDNGIELIKVLENCEIFRELIDLQQIMDDVEKIFKDFFYPKKENEAEAILQSEV